MVFLHSFIVVAGLNKHNIEAELNPALIIPAIMDFFM
jgi:hypothetical protein